MPHEQCWIKVRLHALREKKETFNLVTGICSKLPVFPRSAHAVPVPVPFNCTGIITSGFMHGPSRDGPGINALFECTLHCNTVLSIHMYTYHVQQQHIEVFCKKVLFRTMSVKDLWTLFSSSFPLPFLRTLFRVGVP